MFGLNGTRKANMQVMLLTSDVTQELMSWSNKQILTCAHVHNIARIPAGNIGVEIGIARKAFDMFVIQTGVPAWHRTKCT